MKPNNSIKCYGYECENVDKFEQPHKPSTDQPTPQNQTDSNNELSVENKTRKYKKCLMTQKTTKIKILPMLV